MKKDTKLRRFIKVHCAYNGMTIRQAAESMGYSSTCLANICSGLRKIDEALITKIIEAFALGESQKTALRAISVEINTELYNKRRQAKEVKRQARLAAAAAATHTEPVSQEHVMSHDYVARLFESSLGNLSERQVHALGTTIKCFIAQ